MTKIIEKKKVNITANKPIPLYGVPLRGTINNAVIPTSDILKIICQKGIVDEVLEDGTLVRLTTINYNKDNSHKSKIYLKQQEEAKKKAAEEQARLLKEAEEKAAAEAKAAEEARVREEAAKKAREEALKKQEEEKAKREALVAAKRAAIEEAKAKQKAEKEVVEEQK